MNKSSSNSTPAASLSKPHVIRLHGPWEYQVTGSDGESEGTLRLPVDPATALGEPGPAHITLRRRFGCPSNLEPSERVDLVIERLDSGCKLLLNDLPLGQLTGTAGQTRFNITKLLKPRNELTFELSVATPENDIGKKTLDVRLEIYPSS